MKCVTQELLIAYMEDHLSPVNKQKLESHLDHCTHCQRQLEQCIEALEQENKSPWGNSLPEKFDQKIISALSPHPVRVLNRATHTQKSPLWKKRSITIMKRMTLAAAALTVVVSGGMLISPTFAGYVNAAFTSSPIGKADPAKSVNTSLLQQSDDEGIKQAVQNGFAQSVNVSTTDQGITLEVTEVVADPLRINMIASVKDNTGKPMQIFWQDMYSETDNEPIFTFKDKQGNVLQSAHPSGTGKGKVQNSNKDWQSSRSDSFLFLNHELRSYFEDFNKVPDELIVEFHIKKMAETKGIWKLSVPVDMKKAKAATKTHEINKSYTTPQGLKLDVKQITFAPSGVEMVVDRNSTEDNGKKDYSYELVDDRGTVLGRWNSKEVMGKARKTSNVNDRLKWRNTLPLENGVRDFHYFYPIDQNKSITFKLGSVYTEESAAFRAKLDLALLEKEPVTAEDHGDRFTFKKYVKEPGHADDRYKMNPDGSATKQEGYHLAFEGMLGEDTAPMYPFDAYWSITDENGKKYEDIAYIIDRSDYKNGRAQMEGVLFVLNIDPLPKQLTITATKRMIEHRNVDWEVPILSGK
ncbi:DUF4179 domain-containing protein [Brevibacillus sp. NRS-1366]|uniref:DUF4179 domain-containing protein n=1 Tax=Brevibacillus sp. NRS-1366 TaxID=3233899 RepID=UPI003D1A8212